MSEKLLFADLIWNPKPLKKWLKARKKWKKFCKSIIENEVKKVSLKN